jgi:hypothetical protein
MMNAGEIFTAYQNSQEPPLTDAALARLLEVNRSTICRFKKGERKPSGETLDVIKVKAPKLYDDLIDAMRRHGREGLGTKLLRVFHLRR